MVSITFESIYTETDRYGNQRRWENRLIASGPANEVCFVLSDLLGKIELPGTKRYGLPFDVQKYLSLEN